LLQSVVNSQKYFFMQWLPVVAGLVHARLFGNSLSPDEEIEAGAFYQLEETADKIVEQLSRSEVAVSAKHSLSFQPLELKFLSQATVAGTSSSSGSSAASADHLAEHMSAASTSSKAGPAEGYVKRHFTYCGEVPDLIVKASKFLEERHLTDQKNKNMPAIGKNRDSFRPNPYDGSSSASASGAPSSSTGSGPGSIRRPGLLPANRGSSYGISGGNSRGERQASTIMMLDQVDKGMQQKAGENDRDGLEITLQSCAVVLC
jgi:hypothetical protein